VLAVLDAGPLYAVADSSDDDHNRCLETLERSDLQLVVPALAVAEATYFIGRRLGPSAEAAFLRGLESFDVEAPSFDDWKRIGDLVDEYADFPLGGTDASIAALAERLDTPLVVTLDDRHFRALRPRHCPAFELLPA